MRPINKFWWFAAFAVTATLIVFVVMFFLFWKGLGDEEKIFLSALFRKHFIYLFGAIVLAVAGLGFGLDAFFNTFIIPLIKLAEETRIIHTVNPAHRIRMEAAKEVQILTAAINEMAERHETREKEVLARIETARAASELEKNILAVFMSELSEGVLICNEHGSITFYNRQARQFFETTDSCDTGDGPPCFVGIGRSVFDIIDRHVITYALDDISEKLDKKEAEAVSHFIIPDQKGHLITVETAPILNAQHAFAGFLLIFRDITSQMKVEEHLTRGLQTLTRQTRSSLAGIRTAIETVRAYPQMPPEQASVFHEIIHDETLALNQVLNSVSAHHVHSSLSRLPFVHMPIAPFFFAVKQKALDRLGIHIALPPINEQVNLKCDRYSLTLAIVFLLARVREACDISVFTAEAALADPFIHIDFSWSGAAITADLLKKWEEQPLAVGAESLPLTLREVIGHHDGELCSLREPGRTMAAIRLIFPISRQPPAESKRKITILPQSRPEFFDFDLFQQTAQTAHLDQMPLRAITYTVFDTETTGLNPDAGDKIISIGAVRIVNGRLLKNDFFNQLIDPQRPLSAESIEVHGIQPEMLLGRPLIDDVLPQFKKYSQDSVLVAHNAAFDLKMLKIAEGSQGTPMINPVLDTLLLSALVHPAQNDHTLEGIAQRLGIEVIGRHTALGDAFITGQIMLKLIPLLEKLGIHTLGEARAASRKTYFARLKY
jgi:DNA polymerase-3 subunit epsilon